MTQRQKLVEEINGFAAGAFASHKLVQRLDDGLFRSWRCTGPDGWAYGFDVTTTPGYLIVTGDIGDMVFSRVADMIYWVRSAVDSPDYLAEKCVAGKTHEWCRDIACDELRELLREHKKDTKLLEDITDALAELEDGFREPFMAIYGHRGWDVPACRNFTPEFLWISAAIRVFLRLLDSMPQPDAASP